MVVGALALVALSGTTCARAGAVDGAWCSPDGQRITIFGAAVTTPRGARLTGTYGGDTFYYKAPADEAGGGGMVYLSARPDGDLEVRDGLPTALPRTWQRCSRSS